MDELQSFMTGQFPQVLRAQCIGFKSFFSLILGIVDAGISSAIDDVGDVGTGMKKFFNVCERADIDISMPCRDEGDMLLFAQFLERSTYEDVYKRQMKGTSPRFLRDRKPLLGDQKKSLKAM